MSTHVAQSAPQPGFGTPGPVAPGITLGISAAVGHTPLIRLDHLFPSSGIEILAKLESVNPGGSTKDRPALAMVRDAFEHGRLTVGGTVVESSSGNLGVALARVCATYGVRFVCVVDSRTNATTVATIRALGGEVEMVSEPDPETGDLLTARFRRVEQLLEQLPGAVNLYQYGNAANPGAHAAGTMAEIAEATDHRLDVLMAAVSTTGTIAGCTAYLREHSMDTRTVAVDAEGSVLFGGTAAPRPLPGLGAGVVTDISRTVDPDRVVRVSGLDCVVGARLLARREGILAGASTGGIVHSLGSLIPELAPGSRVAFIVHDGGVPYLDTVYDDAWVQQTLGADADALVQAAASLQTSARRG
ncbi:2,3-diaminopropionate biosynthesis protein SbnA [Brachybacterium sp. FME24]|uniref:2,3-diaminopropionate biosynthesis protein SbnA n=1 Tax=Brachybacterium sp. FME24 TaxID=2742605 RepID=UPI0027148356|nr:2,3-diaminopropionate biosynthesis protein SbnA [Brachybacterium sp. FME24]